MSWTAFARYSFGLTAAPNHSNIFLRPYSRAPSQRYSFGHTAAPHHGDIPLALQLRPIHGDIFFGLATMPHGNNWYFILCLTARVDFILPDGNSRLTAISIFSSPHGDNLFFFASWQEPISFCLTAIHASRWYRISLCLMAIIHFSWPHGKNQFHSAYTAIHATRRYWFSLRLTAIINFSLLQGKFFL